MNYTYKKMSMKDLLSQSLYYRVIEKPFEKITIKQICDKTGVIRGTFYNHFIDKYEALEYLVHQMLLEDETLNDEIDIDHLMKKFFCIVYDHQQFFTRCFQIDGQNSFESMLQNIFCEILNYFFNEDIIELRGIPTNKEFLSSFYSQSVIYILKYWVTHNFKENPDELFRIAKVLLTNNILYFKTNKNTGI